MTITDGEKAVMAELVKRGFMVDAPVSGAQHAAPRTRWGVYAGSHGGSGHTLSQAMKACLACCNIGRWWKIDYGQGTQLARDFFKELRTKHLSGETK